MHEAPLEYVRTETANPAEFAVIWLHGLGADGNDFAPVVPMLHLPCERGIRFIFPHAPTIPVTINGGMVMRAWYDIRDLESRKRHDTEGVRRSARAISSLLDDQDIPSERTILAGFSQGGAMALHVGLQHPTPLAGIVALSTYLVDAELLENNRHACQANTPILQAHGTDDPMVDVSRGREAREYLRSWGNPVEWRRYSMGHEVCAEEIDQVGRFMEHVFRPGENQNGGD